MKSDEIHRMRKAFLALYPKNGGDQPFAARLEAVRQDFAQDGRVQEILAFIDAPTCRGLVRSAREQGRGQDMENA